MLKIKLQPESKQIKPRRKKNKNKLILLLLAFLLLAVFIFPKSISKNYASTNGEDPVQKQGLLVRLDGFLQDGVKVIDSVIDPKLKHDNYITSALLVGIDTRNVSFENGEFKSTKPEGQAGTRNTDTIMQIAYNHETGEVFMINIPRDMGVDVREDCLDFHGSIHWVYDKAQSAQCQGGGLQTLIEVVEGITGIQVQYYGFVTLDAFVEVVETVGEKDSSGKTGVWINNPNNVWEVYPYGDHGWENVFFPKGEIFLDGEQALKYVRSRQITSDFGRARRQQIFMEALKDRVLTADTLLNPQKLLSLLETFKTKTLFSMPSISEIRAGIKLLRSFDSSKIYHLVLDPELGGHEYLINKQPHGRRGGLYYMVPTHWADCPNDEFCKVQEYIANFMKYPEVTNEAAQIYVYGRSYFGGKSNLNNDEYSKFKSQFYPLTLNESKYVANSELVGEIILLDYTNGSKPETIKFLEEVLGIKALPGGKAPGLNINKEEITILIQGK